MIGRLTKAKRILSDSGLSSLISESVQFVFNQKIAPNTPQMYQICNGIIIKYNRLGEIISSEYDTGGFRRPLYEEALRNGAEQVIQPGDSVTILGGGAGVVTVYASRYAGSNGNLQVFEASTEMIEVLQETINRNRSCAPIQIHHAIVGELYEAWGQVGERNHVSITDFPASDIYIIDIEGAELNVIKDLPDCRAVVVESHGALGSPTNQVINNLSNRGFKIKSVGVAEPSRVSIMNEKDIKVTVATRE